MNARALASIAAATATSIAAACGPVSGTQPLPAPVNVCPAHPCEAYRPFVAGGADAQCNAGFCQVSAKIDYTLVVTLPETSYYAPGQSFAIPFAQLFVGANAECPARTCARLPRVATASGYYQPTRSIQERPDPPVGDTTPPGVGFFVGQNVVLPIHVSYVPLGAIGGAAPTDATNLGLPLTPTIADVTFPLGGIPGPAGGPSIGFYAVLPPGTYERRVLPDAPFDAAFPPDVSVVTIAPGVTFDRDVLNALDKIGSGSNSKLPFVDLAREDGGSLDGWTAFVRDQNSLRRLSAIASVGAAPIIAGQSHVFFFMNHHPTAIGTGDPNPLLGTELVVTPPRSLEAMPTLVVPAIAGVLDQALYPRIPAPATVRGSIASTLDALPVAADLVFTSKKIYLTAADPSFSTNLTYTTRATTTLPVNADAGTSDARYSARLPRGEYDVTVSPRDPAYAKKAIQLIVDKDNDPQDGKNLQVDRKRIVRGSAIVADGRSLALADVVASPAASLAAGTPTLGWPRAASTTTDLAGAFTLLLDPGTYDIVVRPAQGSRLPWVVSASRAIGNPDTRLDPIEVPAPIPAGLVLVDPSSNPVVGAVVRVFAIPVGGGAFVEIGRAMTDAQGRYEMLLAGAPH